MYPMSESCIMEVGKTPWSLLLNSDDLDHRGRAEESVRVVCAFFPIPEKSRVFIRRQSSFLDKLRRIRLDKNSWPPPELGTRPRHAMKRSNLRWSEAVFRQQRRQLHADLCIATPFVPGLGYNVNETDERRALRREENSLIMHVVLNCEDSALLQRLCHSANNRFRFLHETKYPALIGYVYAFWRQLKLLYVADLRFDGYVMIGAEDFLEVFDEPD